MRSDRALRGFFAVFLSFVLFFTSSGILFLFFQGGTSPLGRLVSLVPYLGGFVFAAIGMRLMLPYTYDPSAEEEQMSFDDGEEPSSRKNADARLPWLWAAVSLILLLSADILFGVLFSSSGTLSGKELAVAAAIGVLVKPVCEELLFRKAYLDVLVRRGGFPQWAGVLLQALLFAAIHRGYGALFALLAGIVLGALALKGSVRQSIAVHMAYNLTLYAVTALI